MRNNKLSHTYSQASIPRIKVNLHKRVKQINEMSDEKKPIESGQGQVFDHNQH